MRPRTTIPLIRLVKYNELPYATFTPLFFTPQTPVDTDSDSCDINSSDRMQQVTKKSRKPQSKMTSLESVVAAVASMHGVAGLSSLYPGGNQ